MYRLQNSLHNLLEVHLKLAREIILIEGWKISVCFENNFKFTNILKKTDTFQEKLLQKSQNLQ